MSSPFFPFLPPNTIVPNTQNIDTIIQYWNRTYEEIAYNVNARDLNFFPMPISSTAQNIIAVNNFGAYIICVSGLETTLPVITASLVKSTATTTGVINVLGTQAGTGAWAGFNLTITSTPSNFQIQHNRTGVTETFNVRVIGTQ